MGSYAEPLQKTAVHVLGAILSPPPTGSYVEPLQKTAVHVLAAML